MERNIKGIILDTDAFIELNKTGLLTNFIYKFDGYIIPDADLLNSAIAIYNNLPISTNNLKHY